MSMNLEAQLEACKPSFDRLQDSESKISHIKQRIFLMQKLIGEDPRAKIKVSLLLHTSIHPKLLIKNRDEMAELPENDAQINASWNSRSSFFRRLFTQL